MLQNKILFISEALSAPFDEGTKNIAYSLYNQLKRKSNVLTVTDINNKIDEIDVSKVRLNKLFLNYELRKCINSFSPYVILYFPEASVTIASFLRAKILKMNSRSSSVVVLGVQHRKYSTFQEFILKNVLKPDLLLLLGKSDEEFFIRKGVKVRVLPPAVDSVKFSPATKEERQVIRSGYNIPDDKFVILHVGHIKIDRNIECMIEVQKVNNAQVVIVGSTSLGMEKNVKSKMMDAGIIVVDEYVSDIWNIYKMSDLYIFPVKSEMEAIEMPLSVLEAMACNLPVITTRFRGLVEHFEEDACFKFFDDEKKLPEIVENMLGVNATNNRKIERFTWDAFSDELISALNVLS